MFIAFYLDPNNVKFHLFTPCRVHAFDLKRTEDSPKSQHKYLLAIKTEPTVLHYL